MWWGWERGRGGAGAAARRKWLAALANGRLRGKWLAFGSQLAVYAANGSPLARNWPSTRQPARLWARSRPSTRQLARLRLARLTAFARRGSLACATASARMAARLPGHLPPCEPQAEPPARQSRADCAAQRRRLRAKRADCREDGRLPRRGRLRAERADCREDGQMRAERAICREDGHLRAERRAICAAQRRPTVYPPRSLASGPVETEPRSASPV